MEADDNLKSDLLLHCVCFVLLFPLATILSEFLPSFDCVFPCHWIHRGKEWQAGRRICRQASTQAGKQAGRQAGRKASRQAGKQAGRQAGRRASRRAGGQAGRMNITLFVVTTMKDKGAVDGVRKTTASGWLPSCGNNGVTLYVMGLSSSINHDVSSGDNIQSHSQAKLARSQGASVFWGWQ